MIESFSVAGLFGDDMVLQRDAPVPIWGCAPAGAEIVVGFNSVERRCVAGEDEFWRIELPPMPASSHPETIRFEIFHQGASDSRCFDNILVGEVWLCSGQSNMRML